MIKTNYLRLTNENRCADVALRHLLAYYFKNNHYLLIPDKIKENGSLLDIINLAKQYHLTLKGFEVEDNQYLKHLKTPFIALINRDSGPHYVTIIKYKKDRLLVLDGYAQATWIKYHQFIKIFHRYVLTIIETVNLKKRYRSPLQPPLKHKWLLIIVYLASCLCIISGLYLIDDRQQFIAPISLLTLAVIGYLFQKINLFKQLKDYDRLLLEKINIKNKDHFEDYLMFKSFIIMHPYLLINIALLTIFPIALLIINDVYELISFGVLFLIVLVHQLLNKLMINHKKGQLINQETALLQEKMNLDQLKNILNASYKLANLKLNINTITIFLIALMTLLMMAIRGHVYLNYFLFHFFVYYLIFEQLNKLVNFPHNYHDHLQAGYRLIN